MRVAAYKTERERKRRTLTISIYYLGLPSGKREKEEGEVLGHPVPT